MDEKATNQSDTSGDSSATTTTTASTGRTGTRSLPQLQSQERLRKACTDKFELVLSYLLQHNAQLGMNFILMLRDDLLQLIRWRQSLPEQQHDDAHVTLRLKRLDTHIRQLVSAWFSPGMAGTCVMCVFGEQNCFCKNISNR